MHSHKPIGGFFPLSQASDKPEISVTDLWHIQQAAEEGRLATFHNARSALAYIIETREVKRCWLPAYICTDLAEAVLASKADLFFYPVTDALQIDVAWLRRHFRVGDMVVGVNYFGRPPEPAVRDFIQEYSDTIWVEDSAQALSTGIAPWGHYSLTSPRKLMGVADGGIIISHDAPLPTLQKQHAPPAHFNAAAKERAEDLGETQNQQWYARYVAYEQEMGVANMAMSDETVSLMHRIDADAAMKQRQENYHTLFGALVDYAYITEHPQQTGWCPFGFPLRFPQRDQLAKALYEQCIFAAVHWRELPITPHDFPAAAQLSEQLITLPCDQRYGDADMQRVVEAVQTFMA